MPPRSPSISRLGDVLREGSRLREFNIGDVTPQYATKLREACLGDPNVLAVWLGWITHTDAPEELMAILRLEQADERSILRFIATVDALGGPRCAAILAEEASASAPFYRRDA